MEPDEGLEKLQVAFHVCSKYRENYEDRRAHLAEYFKEEPVVEWDFEPGLVFARVDRFTHQLKLIAVRRLACRAHAVYMSVWPVQLCVPYLHVPSTPLSPLLSRIPLQEYFDIVNQFLRLEKIEFGGVRGQMLSDQVAEMFTEFTELSSQFQGQAKEPLDISNTVSLPA